MSETVRIKILPKGIAVLACCLCDDGFLDESIALEVVELFKAGFGWENERFKKLFFEHVKPAASEHLATRRASKGVH